MKNLLDKLDQSSLIVKLLLVLTVLLILATGLFLSKSNDQQAAVSQSPTKTSLRQTATSTSDNTEEIRKAAEKAVKDLEDNPLEEKVKVAKEAVNQLKDEDIKQVLMARIQLIEDGLSAHKQSSSADTPAIASSNEAVVEEDEPVVQYVYPQRQAVEQVIPQAPSSNTAVASDVPSTSEASSPATTTDAGNETATSPEEASNQSDATE